MLRQRPALRLTLLLIGGIMAAEIFTGISAGILLLVLLVAFLFSLFLSLRIPRYLLTSCATQSCVVLLGLILARLSGDITRARRLPSTLEGDTVTVYGTIEEDPARKGKSVRMTVRVDSLDTGFLRDRADRRLAVSGSAKKFGTLKQTWHIGAQVAFRGVVNEFPKPRNPGEMDYGRYLALNEIDGILRLTDTMAVSHSSSLTARLWFGRIRERLSAVIERHHDAEQSAFLRGILLGDRRDIPTELRDSFAITGTIHVLAVSGAHVGVIAIALYAFLGLLRLPKRWIAWLSILGLVFYMMLTGASASVTRAVIMTSVVLAGTTADRRTDIYNSLSVAALIVLLADPRSLWSVGFQLSFVAVLSIVIIYPHLQLLIRKIPARYEEIKALDHVLKLFAVSLSAQLGTLPFTAWYFERVSLVSIGANLLVVPLVGINLVLGCLTLAASVAAAWMAATYAALNEVLVTLLLGFVRAASSVPFAAFETSGFSLASALLYYLILNAALKTKARAMARALLAGLLIGGTVILYTAIFSGPSGPVLRLTAIDVGQGDAILIQFPNHATMLIDAGPRTPGFDAGERIVVPFLRRQGISTIDCLVVSHPHSDHIGGIPFLLSSIRVKAVFEADTIVVSRLHAEMRERTAVSGGEWRKIQKGYEISPDPDARVYCLSPAPLAGSPGNLNNRSMVLKIVYGRTSVLLSGDAEEKAEQVVYRQFGSFLDSDLLKTGHHGSATSSTSVFLNGITPNFAIISVGTRNKFHHPSPAVLKELGRRHIEVHRTDREGAVIFESDGRTWKRERWRNEEQ